MFELRDSVVVLSAGLLLAGCGAGDSAGGGGEAAAAGEEAAAPAAAVDPTTVGTISGRIAFEGTPPAGTPIDMSEEPTCAAKHPDGARTEEVVVDGSGGLKNVFVYIKEGLSGGPYPSPEGSPVLNQNGCVYDPHVLGLRVGQNLTIRNSDGLLHNINAKPTANRTFNISQPTNMETRRSFAMPEVMIPVECDVHGWMRAYIGVVDHPYFAVSAADGTFQIANVPPGTYTVETWHERYGTQTVQVTVAAQETADVQVTYREQMAENAVVPLGRPIHLHDHPAGAHAGAAAGGR
jgi:hypothetical protein